MTSDPTFKKNLPFILELILIDEANLEEANEFFKNMILVTILTIYLDLK